MVTDYDCWREEVAPVEVHHIQAVLAANAGKARGLIAALARNLPPVRQASPIDTCLDGALITARGTWDAAMVEKLSAVAGRVLAGKTGG
jgi:5'-methylthioadenosine phosphorylase